MLAQRPIIGEQLHGIPLAEHAAWIGLPGAALRTHVVGGLFGGAQRAVRQLSRDYDTSPCHAFCAAGRTPLTEHAVDGQGDSANASASLTVV
jgi:hypothetical protein